MASIAPLKQVATPAKLPEILPELANRAIPLAGIGLPLLDTTNVTGDDGNTLTWAGGSELLFGKRADGPGYLWYFDYDGDGRVDFGDLVQLLRQLGQ